MILPRPKVSRLLQQAEDVGVVKITITPQPGLYSDLEEAKEAKFELLEAVVVSVSDPSHSLLCHVWWEISV